jgi:hypothetical protein
LITEYNINCQQGKPNQENEMNEFRIEQGGPEWELIPEGCFESSDEALAAMADLEETLGWRNLRVTERGIDGELIEVVEVGIAPDEDEDDQ